MNTPETNGSRYSLRGFWSLFITQFQGAFSDNALKWLAIFLVMGMDLSAGKRDQLVGVVGMLFSLPFIVFSMAGGFLADRCSKRSVTIGIKVFEILVMGLATISLATHHLNLTIGCVFLMGVHSAFFGPAKYGLLPELLLEKKLSWGNGVLELGTFVSIIAGTVGGGWLCKTFASQPGWSGVILVGLALAGLAWSFGISRVPAADPAKKFRANFAWELWLQMKVARRDRVLWLAVIGNTYFFALAALVQLLIVIYAKDVLRIDDPQKTSYLQAATAIGIGLGSFAAGYLSGGKIEYGLIPLGSVGLTIFSALMGRRDLGFGAAAFNLATMGFFGGFFIVPIAALLQHRPEKENKGSFLAASNLISFIGIFAASGVYYLVTVVLALKPPTVFLLLAGTTFAGTVYVVWLLPDSLLRFVFWVLTRTIYRIRVEGRDNIPAKGGALFVCNHVSFVDALLLLASTDRQVRFMMFKGHYELPYIRPFARILGVIPISSEQRPREMIRSLQMASDAIRAGDVVCIFAEGQITRIGHLLPFRRGFERIMKDVQAPIVPVGLDGVWGSIFSFEKGRFLSKLPRRIPYPVTVNYGSHLPPGSSAFEVRQAVEGLLAQAWKHRRDRMLPLQRGFVRTARLHPFRFAMGDAVRPKVGFLAALVGSIALARRLKSSWSRQDKVGLLLPPSVPGALVNIAALLSRRVPVNLNYTVSEDVLASCIRQCDIQTVVTSRGFLEKVKLKVPCKVLFLEDILGAAARREEGGQSSSPSEVPTAGRPVSFGERVVALAMALLLPVGWLERILGGNGRALRDGADPLDGLATVIFSSGSTGDPKGVQLSHYNVGSNIEQLEQVFGLNRHDRILGVLPFFHSFGFTGTLWLPTVLGVGVVYYPNPLDAKTIGPLVRECDVTFLLATPTFLQLYMRGCSAEDFGGLRVVMTGAEKLPDRLALAFEERFGIRPLEGYGCTECAPVVAVNCLDFRSAGFRQVGAKRGKIGHPVPGVSVRIVDPQTFEPLPTGQAGLMLVHGPNVMQGYLGKPEKTAEVLIQFPAVKRDGEKPQPDASCGETKGEQPGTGGGGGGFEPAYAGCYGDEKWYVTGDIATMDEDGFLQITDRLTRFSKIGGEMVPHIRVEEKLHEIAGMTEQAFVVAGVPDERKGERLVVLHKLGEPELAKCLEQLANSDLPNLWKPRPDQFFRVEAFPYLGTGKLDLRKVREMAVMCSSVNG